LVLPESEIVHCIFFEIQSYNYISMLLLDFYENGIIGNFSLPAGFLQTTLYESLQRASNHIPCGSMLKVHFISLSTGSWYQLVYVTILPSIHVYRNACLESSSPFQVLATILGVGCKSLNTEQE